MVDTPSRWNRTGPSLPHCRPSLGSKSLWSDFPSRSTSIGPSAYLFKLRFDYGFNPPVDKSLGYGKSIHDALAEAHRRAIMGENLTVMTSRA